ncbi:MAG: flagellar biosynthesis anti-sigma factor FlgM [Terriglobia bacterium]|jgi:flagellar biosynthesis anti-sigma factor FlgM
MKIDAPLTFPQQVEPQRVGKTGSASALNQGATVALTPDSAQLSMDGGKVQQLKADLAAVPDLRQDRVAALQKAITSGSYNVSGQQIAQAMSSDLLGGE